MNQFLSTCADSTDDFIPCRNKHHVFSSGKAHRHFQDHALFTIGRESLRHAVMSDDPIGLAMHLPQPFNSPCTGL